MHTLRSADWHSAWDALQVGRDNNNQSGGSPRFVGLKPVADRRSRPKGDRGGAPVGQAVRASGVFNAPFMKFEPFASPSKNPRNESALTSSVPFSAQFPSRGTTGPGA